MAERMGLDRDLALVEMTGVRYHADQLSTAAALPALKRAKAAGLDVTAGVSIHHLTLNELDVGDFRTFFKLKPPLRSEDDRLAMVEAVADGTIDIICSMHTPQDEESKRLPFEAAASGAVGLETLLPAALRLYHAGQVTLPGLIAAMSLNPARRFGLPGGRLPPARRPTWCCSTRTRRSGWTGSPCGRNPRTRPSMARFCKGGVTGTWVGGDTRLRRHGGHRMIPEITSGVGPAGRGRACRLSAGLHPLRHRDDAAFRAGRPAQIGSGNIGATNVLRTGNKTAAALTLILDAGKGGIAVLIARALIGEDAAQIAGLAAFSATAFRFSWASRAARAWRRSSARFWRCSGLRGSRRA
jgi:hypothetical protein